MRSSFKTMSFALFPILFAANRALAQTTLPYQPVLGACPTSLPSIRPGNAISPNESTYVKTTRAVYAYDGLSTWIQGLNAGFSPNNLPALALATSGGGFRSMLSGAGVLQALDNRESSIASPLKGLYQALTYHAGLSGGSWLVSAIAGNNYPTISVMNSTLWSNMLPSMGFGDNTFEVLTPLGITWEKYDNSAKTGLNVTFTDPWGLWVGWNTFLDINYSPLFSSIASGKNMSQGTAPFPIITSVGVNTWNGDWVPRPDATQYEFTPYEFGSWDRGVDAFFPTKYVGTTMNSGKPSTSNCLTNADNMAWIQGTSSNLFNLCIYENNIYCDVAEILWKHLNITDMHEDQFWFANYTNPFYGSSGSPLVANQKILNLVDGGESFQNNPVWPFLQPERNVGVLIVNDNSADINPGTIDGGGYPSGGALYNTSIAARSAGLRKMPAIPTPEIFIQNKLNQRATFFGCDDPNAITIVYLPNYDFTYDSGTPTDQFAYSVPEINGMLGNGNAVATQNGDDEWPICLACGISKKTGQGLPDRCNRCFERYCWRGLME